MRLYLVQHGQAVGKEIDAERPLSERGRSDVQRLAAFLGAAGLRVARLVHSGKTRARQTAEILAATVAPEAGHQGRAGMNPGDPIAPLAEEAARWTGDAMLVGHLPFLGRLASRLLADDESADVLAFEPGSVACLETRPEGGWTLAWMVRPELLAGS